MKKVIIAGAAIVAVLLLAIGAAFWALEPDRGSAIAVLPEATSTVEPGKVHQSYLYGRITTVDHAVFEGRLRFGGHEEAFWGDYFNGVKLENPWAGQVPPERLPKEREALEVFGLEIVEREIALDLSRPFMVRFGDLARIEASGRDVYVRLRSGSVFKLDLYSASDFDDGVRVWDSRGVMDLDSGQILSIDFLPAPGSDTAPARLHGTVRSRDGEFTGFVQWNRQDSLGADTLDGETASGKHSQRFDTIRGIARRSNESSTVILLDGREIVLSGTREVGDGNLGVYVDDPRYGRVLVPWDAFENIEFSPGGSGPSYGDFPPGGPLTGSVSTRDGRRLSGRLVYDLDESEVIETLDAPSQGVDYTVFLGLIRSIVLPVPNRNGSPRARVILHSGEELLLECSGDLGERNAGVLVFANGDQNPKYLPWAGIERIDLDRPEAMYPPLGEP